MAIDLSTDPGGLFRVLGRLGGALNSANAYLAGGDLSAGGLTSVGVGANLIETQLNGSTRQDLTTGLYSQRDAARASLASYKSYLRQLAQAALIRYANDDARLPSLTLLAALQELRRQMLSGAASVTRPTVSASVTAGGSNVGNGKLLASVLGPDGLQLDYVFAESLTARCTADGQGSGTARQETFSLTAPVAQPDPLAWDWATAPYGSGASLSLTAVDALQDVSGGQLLQNGSWKTFTNANAPDNWPIDVGTAGTTILQATGSNVFSGNSGLAFAGNGSELTSVRQPFSTTPSTSLGAGGSPTVIKPSTVYAVSGWVKMSSTPAAGVLEVALVNGSGTITQDAQGANNSITQALTAVSTSWVHFGGFFRTPAANPSNGYRMRVRLSTALTNTHTAYIGHLAMCEATRAYAGGPFLGLFSGSANFLLDDVFTAAVANNYGSKWALLLERLFGLRSLGVAVPSSGSATIPDSYVA